MGRAGRRNTCPGLIPCFLRSVRCFSSRLLIPRLRGSSGNVGTRMSLTLPYENPSRHDLRLLRPDSWRLFAFGRCSQRQTDAYAESESAKRCRAVATGHRENSQGERTGRANLAYSYPGTAINALEPGLETRAFLKRSQVAVRRRNRTGFERFTVLAMPSRFALQSKLGTSGLRLATMLSSMRK